MNIDEQNRSYIIEQFLKEIGLSELSEVSTTYSSGDKWLKIKIITATKTEILLDVLTQGLTIEKLKAALYKRYIIELKSEIKSHKIKIDALERQIDYIENQISALNHPKNDDI